MLFALYMIFSSINLGKSGNNDLGTEQCALGSTYLWYPVVITALGIDVCHKFGEYLLLSKGLPCKVYRCLVFFRSIFGRSQSVPSVLHFIEET